MVDQIVDTLKFIMEERSLWWLMAVIFLVILVLAVYFTRGIQSLFLRLLALPVVCALVLLIFVSPLLVMWGVWEALRHAIGSPPHSIDLILGFMTVVGMGLFWGYRIALHRQRWLEKNGIRVQAVVVEHRCTIVPDLLTEDMETDLIQGVVNPVYHYEVNGETYEFISNVTVDENGPEVGAVQYLYVDPASPKRCIGEGDGVGPLLLYGWIGFGLIAIFLIRLAFLGSFRFLAGIVIFLLLMDWIQRPKKGQGKAGGEEEEKK